MTLPITADQVKRAQKIVLEVQRLQGELFSLGLLASAHRMGAVNHRLGFEIAERMEASGLLGKDETKRRARHAKINAAGGSMPDAAQTEPDYDAEWQTKTPVPIPALG